MQINDLYWWAIEYLPKSVCEKHVPQKFLAEANNARKEIKAGFLVVVIAEMVGWHHQFNGHELGQTPGDGEGQGGLVCCSPWGRKELDTTWQLNSNHRIVPSVGESLWTCTMTEKYQELRHGRLCISSVPWTPEGNPRSHHSWEPWCTLPTRVHRLGALQASGAESMLPL